MAQTGVQILAGFLLTIPFAPRFESLPDSRKVVYAVVLCAAMLATFMLMTPVALHRALFHRGERPWLVEAADVAARMGLAALAVANVGALWLILDFIANTYLASAVAGALGLAVLFAWVILPRYERSTA